MARSNWALALPVAALIVSVIVPTQPWVTIVCAMLVLACLAAMAVGRYQRAKVTR